ncbi:MULTISPECIES: hypothetical protein [Planktothricoides]|nr:MULTISPECIES: hypothetical protein [Planktothricoides]
MITYVYFIFYKTEVGDRASALRMQYRALEVRICVFYIVFYL